MLLEPVDTPTLTVIVDPDLACTATLVPDTGSVDLGYGWLEPWLSASQVNVTAPSAIVTVEVA